MGQGTPAFSAETVAVLRYLQGSPLGRAPAIAGERADAAELFCGGSPFLERKCPPPHPHLQRTLPRKNGERRARIFCGNRKALRNVYGFDQGDTPSRTRLTRSAASDPPPERTHSNPPETRRGDLWSPARSLFANLRQSSEQTTVILSGTEGGVEGSPHRRTHSAVLHELV